MIGEEAAVDNGWKRRSAPVALAIVAFIAMASVSGCGTHEVKAPYMTGSAVQMQQAQQKAAADYAAYMQAKRTQSQGN
jgi:hypothetical protein